MAKKNPIHEMLLDKLFDKVGSDLPGDALFAHCDGTLVYVRGKSWVIRNYMVTEVVPANAKPAFKIEQGNGLRSLVRAVERFDGGFTIEQLMKKRKSGKEISK